MAKYVIVGASAAGVGAVEAIRKVDPVGKIIVISEEACADYSRPMISDLVSGKADIQKMKCKTDSFWNRKQGRSTLRQKSSKPKPNRKNRQLRRRGKGSLREAFTCHRRQTLCSQDRRTRQRRRIHLYKHHGCPAFRRKN